MYAPIIVFAYNRPDHLDQTLTALANNPEASDSVLYVLIDGPKNELGREKNRMVETVARKFENGFFSSVIIKNSVENKGLASAIISGVSKIIGEYGRVIVTEDDAVPANSYLSFMNGALDYYEKKENIWSVGGYTIPMKLPEEYCGDVILTQRSSSYAWATWKNRWEKIDWNMSDYNRFHFDFKSRKGFNLWGDDRASMLDDQMLGRVNSWAIRFDYAMFRNGMYNIIPRTSLIKNIGYDGSGTHSTVDVTINNPFSAELQQTLQTFTFDCPVIDEQIRKEFIKPFHSRKINLAKRFVGNLYRKWIKND